MHVDSTHMVILHGESGCELKTRRLDRLLDVLILR